MGDAPSAAALVWDRGEDWSASLQSLQSVAGLDFVSRTEGGFAQAIAAAFETRLQSLVVLTGPVLVPSGVLDFAAAWTGEDPRVAAVSFLTGTSLPVSNGETAGRVTQKLRRAAPHPGRVPISIPQGGAVLISRSAFLLCGMRTAFDDEPDLALADFALRASRRGLFTFLDAQTFVLGPAESELPDYSRLYAEHPSFSALYEHERADDEGPLALALNYARASYSGLRILIDGSCLGPHEMGTQVQTAAFANALTKHPSVQWVGVGMPGSTMPPYAENLLSHEKIRFYPNAGELLADADPADIIHRPYQPAGILPFEAWRAKSKRIVLTVLDLIVYRNGAYVSSPERWLQYRNDFREVLRRVDGAIAISRDVAQSIEDEKLGIAYERLCVAPLGTDHLTADAQTTAPAAIRQRGWDRERFALVLGTDYAHKNRDIAIRAWTLLKDRGYDLRLVLAGPRIPFGSSGDDEISALAGQGGVLTLPDVSPSERNWLLQNAVFVLYPTSAEGFGLVPFEAAVFGTPTIAVSFGPVREFNGPGAMAGNWDPEELASMAQAFLDDPASVRRAVDHARNRAAELTWARSADALVQSYFKLLAMPPVENLRHLQTERENLAALMRLKAETAHQAEDLSETADLLSHLSRSRVLSTIAVASPRLRSARRRIHSLLDRLRVR